MYVAGTNSLQHVAEWPLIPLGQIERSQIYKRAREYLDYYPEVKTIVAHSMGAVVGEHLASEFGLNVRTQGGPYISYPWESHPERTSNLFDPVSFADLSAKHQLPRNWLNPHNY